MPHTSSSSNKQKPGTIRVITPPSFSDFAKGEGRSTITESKIRGGKVVKSSSKRISGGSDSVSSPAASASLTPETIKRPAGTITDDTGRTGAFDLIKQTPSTTTRDLVKDTLKTNLSSFDPEFRAGIGESPEEFARRTDRGFFIRQKVKNPKTGEEVLLVDKFAGFTEKQARPTAIEFEKQQLGFPTKSKREFIENKRKDDFELSFSRQERNERTVRRNLFRLGQLEKSAGRGAVKVGKDLIKGGREEFDISVGASKEQRNVFISEETKRDPDVKTFQKATLVVGTGAAAFAITPAIPLAVGGSVAVTKTVGSIGSEFRSKEVKSIESEIGKTNLKNIINKARVEEELALQKRGFLPVAFAELNPALSVERGTFDRSVKQQAEELGLNSDKILFASVSTRNVQSTSQFAGDLSAAGGAELIGRKLVGKSFASLGSVKATNIGRVTFGRGASATGRAGLSEGFSAELVRGSSQNRNVDLKNVALGGVVGSAFAGGIGGTIISGAFTKSKFSKAVNVFANVVDPIEKPGDVLADIGQASVKRVGGKVSPDVKVRVVGTPVFNFSPSSPKFESTTNLSSSLGSVVINPVRNKSNLNVITESNTKINTETKLPVPNIIPTKTDTIIPVPEPDKFVNQNIITNVETDTKNIITNINVPVTSFQEFPPVPFGFPGGGVGSGRRGRKGKGRQRRRLTPQLAAIVLGLKGGTKKKKNLSGFEFRGL